MDLRTDPWARCEFFEKVVFQKTFYTFSPIGNRPHLGRENSLSNLRTKKYFSLISRQFDYENYIFFNDKYNYVYF